MLIMANLEEEMENDPITAAFPRNSDYITYLTILVSAREMTIVA